MENKQLPIFISHVVQLHGVLGVKNDIIHHLLRMVLDIKS